MKSNFLFRAVAMGLAVVITFAGEGFHPRPQLTWIQMAQFPFTSQALAPVSTASRSAYDPAGKFIISKSVARLEREVPLATAFWPAKVPEALKDGDPDVIEAVNLSTTFVVTRFVRRLLSDVIQKEDVPGVDPNAALQRRDEGLRGGRLPLMTILTLLGLRPESSILWKSLQLRKRDGSGMETFAAHVLFVSGSTPHGGLWEELAAQNAETDKAPPALIVWRTEPGMLKPEPVVLVLQSVFDDFNRKTDQFILNFELVKASLSIGPLENAPHAEAILHFDVRTFHQTIDDMYAWLRMMRLLRNLHGIPSAQEELVRITRSNAEAFDRITRGAAVLMAHCDEPVRRAAESLLMAMGWDLFQNPSPSRSAAAALAHIMLWVLQAAAMPWYGNSLNLSREFRRLARDQSFALPAHRRLAEVQHVIKELYGLGWRHNAAPHAVALVRKKLSDPSRENLVLSPEGSRLVDQLSARLPPKLFDDGRRLQDGGLFNELLDLTDQALPSYPFNLTLYEWRIQALRQLNRSAEALDPAREVVLISGNRPYHRSALASVLSDLGRHDEAEAEARAIIQKEPHDSFWRVTLSNVLFARGDFTGAMAAADEAVEKAGPNPRARAITRTHRVYMAIDTEQFERAEPWAEELVKDYPENSKVLWALGRIQYALNKPQEALQMARRAIAAAPARVVNHVLLIWAGDALARSGTAGNHKLYGLDQELARSFKRHRIQVDVCVAYAEYLWGRGRMREARETLELALELEPGDPDALELQQEMNAPLEPAPPKSAQESA